MGEDSVKNILIALTLFVAFSWLILTVAIDFGAEYGREAQEIGEGSLNNIDFKKSGSNVSRDASAFKSRFESGKVDDVDDASGIFSIVTDMISLIITPFKLLSSIMVNIFHAPVLIINVILGLLTISIIFGIWRLLRAGS